MDQVLALLGFAFVSTVTPGPNNLLLWGSGTRFGFRRTWPHVVGTGVGVGLVGLAVAAGIGALLTAAPGLQLALKVAGSIYLLYLAVRIARSAATHGSEVDRPFGLWQAAAFQLLNPKVWIFALGAMTTFRPTELPVLTGSVLVAAVMVVAALAASAAWAGAGGLLSRIVADPPLHRAVALAMAALLVATVATVWL